MVHRARCINVSKRFLFPIKRTRNEILLYNRYQTRHLLQNRIRTIQVANCLIPLIQVNSNLRSIPPVPAKDNFATLDEHHPKESSWTRLIPLIQVF